MFRNETTVAGSVLGGFPGSAEVIASGSRQDKIPRAGRLKELQQLARRVGQAGFPRSGQHFTIFELYVPAQSEGVAILWLVAD